MDKQPGYGFDVVSFFPRDFFDKDVNEPFVQKVIACLGGKSDWRKGDPNVYEPDYFCGSIPFEITLASDHKSRDNFIQRLTRGHYTTPDAEEDAIPNATNRNFSVVICSNVTMGAAPSADRRLGHQSLRAGNLQYPDCVG